MPNKNGLILVKPTSVDKTGTGSTATISANGSVEFSACTGLRLNGVFSSDYDNYLIVMREKNASGTNQMQYRYASSGSDTSTTTYTGQELYADGTSLTGYRSTSATSVLSVVANTSEGGFILNVYGPYLAQPTASRGVSCDSRGGALITDVAGTQSGSTSFDGINFLLGASTFSGRVAVYGMRK